jgi:hypothetical protein
LQIPVKQIGIVSPQVCPITGAAKQLPPRGGQSSLIAQSLTEAQQPPRGRTPQLPLLQVAGRTHSVELAQLPVACFAAQVELEAQ